MRNDLVKAIAQSGRQSRVQNSMHRTCAAVDVSKPLRATSDKMHHGDCSKLLVLQVDGFEGLSALENGGELVMLSEAAICVERQS